MTRHDWARFGLARRGLIFKGIDMTEEELTEFLVGKTIGVVDTSVYMGRVALEALVFNDGSRVELFGQGDMVYVWEAVSPDKKDLHGEGI